MVFSLYLGWPRDGNSLENFNSRGIEVWGVEELQFSSHLGSRKIESIPWSPRGFSGNEICNGVRFISVHQMKYATCDLEFCTLKYFVAILFSVSSPQNSMHFHAFSSTWWRLSSETREYLPTSSLALNNNFWGLGVFRFIIIKPDRWL